MTRGGGDGIAEEVPGAIYTISKNVLGRNVTDTIAPLVREALPVIPAANRPLQDDRDVQDKGCTTPDGGKG